MEQMVNDMEETRRIFEIKRRTQAENSIASITEKNPVEKTRLTNSYWQDHLRRIKRR